MCTEREMIKSEERRHLDALYWGGVLIWAGLVFGAEKLGYLPQIGEAGPWSWIFVGVGLYGLLGALWRLSSPRYSNPTTWDYIWSGFLLIVGLGGLSTFDITWPLMLVLVGVILLGSALVRRR